MKSLYEKKHVLEALDSLSLENDNDSKTAECIDRVRDAETDFRDRRYTGSDFNPELSQLNQDFYPRIFYLQPPVSAFNLRSPDLSSAVQQMELLTLQQQKDNMGKVFAAHVAKERSQKDKALSDLERQKHVFSGI